MDQQDQQAHDAISGRASGTGPRRSIASTQETSRTTAESIGASAHRPVVNDAQTDTPGVNRNREGDEAPVPPPPSEVAPSPPPPPLLSALSNRIGSGGHSSSVAGSNNSDDDSDDPLNDLEASSAADEPESIGVVAMDGQAVSAAPDTSQNPVQPAQLQRHATPSTHSYLGETRSETIRPRRDLEVGSILDMPILPLSGVILFPGESLPLRLGNSGYANLVRSILSGDGGEEDIVRQGPGEVSEVRSEAASRRPGEGEASGGSSAGFGHLGVINGMPRHPGMPGVDIYAVGTTAEIRSGYGDVDFRRDFHGDDLAVIARGRHRFRIVERLGWRRGGIWYCKVVICPDLCPAPIRAPVPRLFREINDRRSCSRRERGRRSGGRGFPRNWVLAAPRFAIESNSPAALVARAAYLLQRNPDWHGLQPGQVLEAVPAPASAGTGLTTGTGIQAIGQVLDGQGRAVEQASAIHGLIPGGMMRYLARARVLNGGTRRGSSAGEAAAVAVAPGSSTARTALLSSESAEAQGVVTVAGAASALVGEDELSASGDAERPQQEPLTEDAGMCGDSESEEDTTGRYASGVESDDNIAAGGGLMGLGVSREPDNERGEVAGSGLWLRRKIDPTLFSFWLSANLPLDDCARQRLLVQDNVLVRLRMLITHLETPRQRELQCQGCGMPIAWEKDVFTVPGAEGVVGAYVNPDGHVHQTVTVRDVRNVQILGEPVVEDSWFPGYAWSLLYCQHCPAHLGWRFAAVNAAHPDYVRIHAANGGGGQRRASGAEGNEIGPPEFYGLRRPAISVVGENEAER